MVNTVLEGVEMKTLRLRLLNGEDIYRVFRNTLEAIQIIEYYCYCDQINYQQKQQYIKAIENNLNQITENGKIIFEMAELPEGV